jgi:hypothetical protein
MAGEAEQLCFLDVAGRWAALLRVVRQPSIDHVVGVAVDDLLLDWITEPQPPLG